MLRKNLKLSQIFFINFILLMVGTLLFASIIIYYSIEKIEIKQYTNQLKSELAYVQSSINEGKSLKQAADEMSDVMGRPLRVTLIDLNGKPIYDNEVDTADMLNYLNKPEVMKARRNGYATAVRYSEAIKNERIYVAKKIKWNEKDAILRLSISLEQAMNDFKELWLRIAMVFLIALIVGFVISRAIQREIDAELGKVTEYLKAIASKKYNAQFLAGFSKEFQTIATLLKKLAKRLEKGEKRKRKYTAKLRLINRQRSEIISAISHEFKNPVAAIIGYTETLMEDRDLPISVREKFLQRIEENTKRISNMIDRLSFITRLESSEVEPCMSEFKLNEIVHSVAHSLMQKYSDRKVTIDEKEVVTICADKTMMEMVVANLIDNALKYSDSDVVVSLDSKRFSVTDYGEGINEAEIEEVTKKFYRVQKNSWDNSMGLGLAIVKYILRLHHIELQIDSKKKKGTTVSFSLPSVSLLPNMTAKNSKASTV